MLQSISSVFVVYRRKTLTGSPDPTHANGTDKPCTLEVAGSVSGKVRSHKQVDVPIHRLQHQMLVCQVTQTRLSLIAHTWP